MQNVMPVRFRRAVRDVPAAVTRDEVQPADAPATVDAVVAAPAVRHATVDAVTTVDGVDLGSLASLAVRCALAVTAIGALGTTLLWVLASRGGVVGRIESFLRDIGFRDFDVSGGQVVLGMTLLTGGIALTVASAVVIAGAVYNRLATRGRGLRIRLGRIVVLPVGDHDAQSDSSASPASAYDGNGHDRRHGERDGRDAHMRRPEHAAGARDGSAREAS